MVIAIFCVILFDFSYALLVWLDFAQWVFDKYINPKLEGAKVGRGIYNKDGTSTLTGDDSAAALEYQRIILEECPIIYLVRNKTFFAIESFFVSVIYSSIIVCNNFFFLLSNSSDIASKKLPTNSESSSS